MARSRSFYLLVVVTVGLLFVLQALSPAGSHAGGLVWMKTYDGPSNNWDQGQGVAVAPDGSIYVTGGTEVLGQKYFSLLLQKYAPNGALVWMKTYDGLLGSHGVGCGVAVAADGSVYVSGTNESEGQDWNLLLRKYSPKGALLWRRTYNGAVNGIDIGDGVAVAPDGSIYVTGSTEVAGQGWDLLLRKYAPNGALVWMKTYNGARNGWDRGFGVAVAADGNVYVTGETSCAEQGTNLLLRKYSPEGALLWKRTYNGNEVTYSGDLGYHVAVAADGSVYVTGRTEVARVSYKQTYKLLLQKYAPNGALVWMKTYDGLSDSWRGSGGVAVAADGSIYVTGSTEVAEHGTNLLLRKYSPNGDVVWMKTYDGAGRGDDTGQGVATAADGSVYVTGSTEVIGTIYGGQYQSWNANLLLRKYK